MRDISTLIAGASALFIVNAAYAQTAEEAADAVAEAAEEAAEAAAETASDAPPPIRTVPVAPPPPVAAARDYPTEPRPTKSLYRLIKPADYPIESWNAGEEGRVDYEITVNAMGQPTDCKIIESSGYSALDEMTCRLMMERAEFDPAMEADEAPIAGRYEGSQAWRKREPEMPQMSITFQYLHDEMGESSECKFLKMEGDIPQKMLDDIERDRERGNLCPGGRSNRGVPYRDENGVPVTKLVTVTFDVVLEDPAE